jgi:hypothetical protein
MDVHVPQAITDQLRRRGVDVLTAIEDDSTELPDDELLEHASQLELNELGYRAYLGRHQQILSIIFSFPKN